MQQCKRFVSSTGILPSSEAQDGAKVKTAENAEEEEAANEEEEA